MTIRGSSLKSRRSVFYSLDEIISEGKESLILILDSVTDAGNLGAIIRTAVAAGVDGIILSQRNSAPLNDTVLKHPPAH